MKRRPTFKRAWMRAMIALTTIANNRGGAEVAQRALNDIANPLPVDTGQLRRLANGFCDGYENTQVQPLINEFLTYIKENAK